MIVLTREIPPPQRGQKRQSSRKLIEEDDMENPEPTETEHELAGTERHHEEEDMRGVNQADDDEDNLPSEDE